MLAPEEFSLMSDAQSRHVLVVPVDSVTIARGTPVLSCSWVHRSADIQCKLS